MGSRALLRAYKTSYFQIIRLSKNEQELQASAILLC